MKGCERFCKEEKMGKGFGIEQHKHNKVKKLAVGSSESVWPGAALDSGEKIPAARDACIQRTSLKCGK